MIKYIVVDSGSSASRLMFRDVKKLKNVIETSELFIISNPLLRILNKVHMSGKLNRFFNIPFKKIWDRYYITEKIKANPYNHYIIIFTNISIRKIRLGYLQELGKHQNIHLVLVAVDSFVDINLSPLSILDKIPFDLVYSFDPHDCKQYGLEFTNSIYSRRLDILAAKEQTDIFFIGRAKDRYSLLLLIAQRAHDAGLKINFQILGVKKKAQIQFPGITYLKKVKPYDEVLPLVKASKCLLDIYQTGQKGLTMRVYEAIFYNKRLITNNDYIAKLDYYNPKYMQIIRNAKEIDFSFISQDNDVDYKYRGEYSPIYFLKQVERKLHEGGKL